MELADQQDDGFGDNTEPSNGKDPESQQKLKGNNKTEKNNNKAAKVEEKNGKKWVY